MYCKLFASLYQGTLRGRSHEILVFTNLMAHASKDGYVDKHFRAIAEETGLTIDEVKAAIVTLESSDEESRSPAANGARLRRMDEHRVWGWEIVNYAKYRAIRNEEDRAEQNRLAQARWREKHKQSKPPSAESKPDKPMQRQEAEGEAKADADTKPKRQKRSIDLVGFDAFWRMYPKKVGKSDAVKEWAKLTPEEIEAAERSLPLHLKSVSWLKEGGKYIPHPHRWLNKKRWEDELPAAILSDVQAIETDNDELGFLNNDNAIFHKDRP